MMRVAKNTLSEIDAIMFMVNVNEDIGRGDEYIMEMLKNVKTPIFLVLNKIDLVHPDALMPRIEKYKEYMDFTEIIPISALEGLNVDHFIDVLKSYLPVGRNTTLTTKFLTTQNNLLLAKLSVKRYYI